MDQGITRVDMDTSTVKVYPGVVHLVLLPEMCKGDVIKSMENRLLETFFSSFIIKRFNIKKKKSHTNLDIKSKRDT